MKILNIHKTINPGELAHLLQQQLNTLFKEQRQTAINFTTQINNGIVEIAQPELYDGVLFSIEVHGNELHITRSEHYVDDVNSLTIESILNELIKDLAADSEVTFVLEG